MPKVLPVYLVEQIKDLDEDGFLGINFLQKNDKSLDNCLANKKILFELA